MDNFLKWLVYCFLALVAGMSACRQGPSREPLTKSPANCLLIVLDAARADHFSTYGYGRPTTPNIDRLARKGFRFDSAFSQSSSTSWSVASYIMGMNPASLGFAQALPEGRRSLTESFKSLGYQTGFFSENPNLVAVRGYARGVDQFRQYLPHRLLLLKEDFALDSEITLRDVKSWIRSVRDKPWFGYVHLLRPHEPYAAPKPFRGRFSRPYSGTAKGNTAWFRAHGYKAGEEDTRHLLDQYDENLAYADHLVGELEQALKELSLLESTMIIVTADHGEAFMEHGYLSHNITLYDEMIHVPLIFVPPRAMGVGQGSSSALVDLVSIYPTLAELFAFETPSGLDGSSFAGILRGNTKTGRDVVYSHSFMYSRKFAVRSTDAKLIHILAGESGSRVEKKEMYRLSDDPGERRNLLATQAGAEPSTSTHAGRPGEVETRLTPMLTHYYGRNEAKMIDDSSSLPKESLDALRALGYVE